MEFDNNDICVLKKLGIKKIGNDYFYFNANDEFLLNTLKNYETAEIGTSETIRKIVKIGQNVINIGANIGYFTILLANFVGPSGKVFSFEAFPETANFLTLTVATNGYNNVKIIPKAVSNQVGETHLFLTESCLCHLLSAEKKDNSIPIQVTTIDEYFHSYMEKIDFVLIDAEGSESFILEGMKDTLFRNPQMNIIIEYNAHTLNFTGSSGEQLLDKILEYEFQIFMLVGEGVVKKVGKDELLKNFPPLGEKTNICNLLLTKNPKEMPLIFND